MSGDERQLYSRRFGHRGPACVILHGLLGSGENWQTPAKKLASSGFTVYTPDLRNHGNSFHHEEMDYTVMADDIHRFISDLDEKEAYVIGHSMGGKVGMELALRYPGDVRALVVVDISPFRYKPVYANVFSALQDIAVGELNSRSQADRQLEEKVPDRMVRLFLLKNLRRDENGSFYWRINLKALSKNYHHIWAEIDTSGSYEKPILFMEGEKSEAGIKPQFDKIKEIFPSAAYRMIEGAGHWVHSDKPKEFLRSVKEFLNDPADTREG